MSEIVALKPQIETGPNLFQGIKAVCKEAEESGQKLFKLSIGQPSGPAFRSACEVASLAIKTMDQEMHEYQDNGCLPMPDFARRFVQAHVKTDLSQVSSAVSYLPIPGIKPMLGVVIHACLQGERKGLRQLGVFTTTNPGYPTPADQCHYIINSSRGGSCSHLRHCALTTDISNQFHFDPRPISDGFPPAFFPNNGKYLIMMNYPSNPTGQVATREWLEMVCSWCEKGGVRLFNDAAYAALAHSDDHCTLADVAVNYPNLSWAEAYSASKIGNFTGWRVGAMIGSPDFIADIATIKGNTDSGFNAALALGVLHVLEHDRESLDQTRWMYRDRMCALMDTLENAGMRLAIKPKAGFFTLWQCPNEAFGEKIESAEQFNHLMIRNTGIVGVHFHPYIRYAVCGDVHAMAIDIINGFRHANVKYDSAQ